MKHVDYLYFNIYNYFYRLSLYRQTINPRMQTMYLFSLGSGGWLLLLESTYLHFVKHQRFTSPLQSMVFASSLYLLTALLFHYVFIVKDRDQKIYGKYEAGFDKNPRKRRHLIASILVLAIPYAGLMSLAVLFPRN